MLMPAMAFAITIAQVSKIMPRHNANRLELYLPFIQTAMHEFEINTPNRAAAFLAQLAHESGEFLYMEELADGSAYEGRKDLGNINPGDGRKFKGRGPIQLTGRANYREFGKLLGLDLENYPELASKPEVGFRIAACFWKKRGLNQLADEEDFHTLTRKLNGGLNGIEKRLKYYKVAMEVLNEA